MRMTIAGAALAAVLPVAAAAYEPVSGRDEFLAIVEGRELRIGILGISIFVQPDGTIEGDAQGWPITGTWTWEDGYFCREMDWGGYAIAYNCQLVEWDGNGRVRFTVDRGSGESAAFNLR